MRTWVHLVSLVSLVTAAVLTTVAPASPARAQPGALPAASARALPHLRVSVRPDLTKTGIKVGRDVPVQVRVTDEKGKPVNAVLVSITVPYSTRPLLGTAPHGVLTLTVHATLPTPPTSTKHPAYAPAMLTASKTGYTPASLKLPIVDGPPATIAAVKKGVTVQAPRAKPQAGKVGLDLLQDYHAITTKGQFASLGLRDGTLVDLNTNTDVLIKDPLHATLTKGEVFLEVVHGAVSHQVQVGTAVAATKGTRLDVRYNPTTKAAVVTVVEGQVQVSNSANKGPGASVLVGAGQQSTVTGTAPPSPPKPVNLAAILAWVKNLPNTNKTTVPPVLNLPPPPATAITLPPPAPTPAITVTGVLSSTTWSGGPYLIRSSATLPAGSTLSIAPGTTVEMGQGAVLRVAGVLKAQGSDAAPIVFTSAARQPKPGDWQYIDFDGAGAAQSILDHVQVYYGSLNGGAYGTISVTNGANLTLSNDVVAQSYRTGIWVDDASRPTITNCIFSGDGGAAIDAPIDELTLITGSRFGAGQAGYNLRTGSITHSGTWQKSDVPFTIAGTATIAAGTTITIAPSTVVKMGQGVPLHVSGVLKAQGTDAAPIVFTSAAAQPRPGDWQYINFDGQQAGQSVFDHVQVFYGSLNGGAYGTISVTNGANLTLSNDVVAQSYRTGIWVDDASRPTITNCVFAGDGGAAIDAPVDELSLITGSGFGPGQPGYNLRTGSVTHSGTWQKPDVPFTLAGTATIAAGTTITIASGTIVQMGQGAPLHIAGILKAQGTDAAPIVFTSAAAQPRPGDWQYINFDGKEAGQSVFDHVQVFYGSLNGGAYGTISVTNGANLTLSNDVVGESYKTGIWVDDVSRPTITNCVFAGDGGAAIDAPVDELSLISGSGFSAGQAGYYIRGGAVTHSGTWQKADVPFTLAGSVTIAAGVTVTVAPGTVVQMGQGAPLTVQGTLKAQGTDAAPIVFTSAAQQPKPGDWQYVKLDGTGSSNSVLDHVQAMYGSANGGAYGMIAVTGGSRAAITHAVIAHGSNNGIWVDDLSAPTIAFCSFSDDKGAAISLRAKDPQRVHDNTFASGQKGMEVRSQS